MLAPNPTITSSRHYDSVAELDQFRAALDARGCRSRPGSAPHQFYGFCPHPAHDDRKKPSFSFGIGDRTGQVVWHCHKPGCPIHEDNLELRRLLGTDWSGRMRQSAPDIDHLLRLYADGKLRPRRVGFLTRWVLENAPEDAKLMAAHMELQQGLRMAVGVTAPLMYATVPNARRLGWGDYADQGRKRFATAMRWLEANALDCVDRLAPQNGMRFGTKCYAPKVRVRETADDASSSSVPRAPKRAFEPERISPVAPVNEDKNKGRIATLRTPTLPLSHTSLSFDVEPRRRAREGPGCTCDEPFPDPGRACAYCQKREPKPR